MTDQEPNASADQEQNPTKDVKSKQEPIRAQDKLGAHGGRQNKGRRTHWSAKQVAVMGLFAAIGVVLSFIEIPLFPGMAFLKYDPSNVPATLGGIAYGPGLGALVGIIIHGLHGFFGSSGFIGAAMNIVAVLAFMLPVAILCRKSKTLPRMIIGLSIGSVLTIAAMIIMNLTITPAFMGVPYEQVVEMIVPILLPFNIIKSILNSVVSILLYLSLRKVLEK